MNSLDDIVREFFPDRKISPFKKNFIKWIIGSKRVNEVVCGAPGTEGVEWVSSLTDSLVRSLVISSDDLVNIPPAGPAIIISNHPTICDGPAVITAIANVRKDIKIVANHILPMLFPEIEKIAIGIKNMNGKMSRSQFKMMNDHLKAGGVLILFPAGKLASLTVSGLKEAPWHPGFLQLAARHDASVIPVHIRGKNSAIYYLAALIWRPLSNLMILREISRHRRKSMSICIGQPVDLNRLSSVISEPSEIASRCLEHLLRLRDNRSSDVPVIPLPGFSDNKQRLSEALSHCEVLKKCSDGKVLYLCRCKDNSTAVILNELGRLRSISYRQAGAGTGNLCDNDIYDYDYYHIILWDPVDSEIAGAYRAVPVAHLLNDKNPKGLYSYSLFRYSESFIPELRCCMEIGRGFIQKKYQKTAALDNLWKGIFCLAKRYPECTRLLGVLTIPGDYPLAAKKIIVTFYQLYFSVSHPCCDVPEHQFIPGEDYENVFSGDDFVNDWKKFNHYLSVIGAELPWPYKQAARWYIHGGSELHCFTEDRMFNSVAGLNICDISKLKKSYFSHYLKKQES